MPQQTARALVPTSDQEPKTLVAVEVEATSGGALALWAGDDTADSTEEFLFATIRNPNTRRAYRRAVARFVVWCRSRDLPFETVSAVDIAAHVEELSGSLARPSVKLHLAALKHWFDFLTVRQVVAFSPAAAVRGPKHSVSTGMTPVMDKDEARQLLDSIDGSTLIGARDKALISVMLFSFARIGAVIGMKVRDYRGAGSRNPELVLHEKGGKLHKVPAHLAAAEHIEAWLALSGLADQPDAPLWQTVPHRSKRLTGVALEQSNACRMVKRRCMAAGLPRDICNHSFRAMGVTYYLDAGGDLETARQFAAHSSVKTTQLYNRSGDKKRRAELDRVQL